MTASAPTSRSTFRSALRWTPPAFFPFAFALTLFAGLFFAGLFFAGCGGAEEPSESGGDKSAATSDSTDPAESAEETSMPDSTADENGGAAEADLDPAGPVVAMRTSLGDLRIELFPDEAPETAANFLEYVEDGFYDGTIFHRVVRGFVIQGGGFTAEMEEKETRAPIENEATNGLRNRRGTLAMARTGDPHSASSQFFVNTKDNAMLDHTGQDRRGWGYAVFGRVISGMETVDRIEASPVVSRNGHNDVPDTPVVIESATVVSR